MKVGTKSVLYGAHCFFIHPWFVWVAWVRLFGWTWDPRIMAAFFLHDLGYLRKPNMDGPEGESHPELGARIMTWLFDWSVDWDDVRKWIPLNSEVVIGPWGQFSLFHSRYYSKSKGHPVSKLCFADKMSFVYTPRWLYLPMVNATGEIREYLKNAQTADSKHWKPTGDDQNKWHAQICEYMTKWVAEHVNGADDTWTNDDRHNGGKTYAK